MNKALTYIDTQAHLEQVCRQFKTVQWLAVDTEFERTRTYYPELCLLQVASDDVTAVIDPIMIPDPAPLFAILYDPAITKVFHAARQDLELFFNLKGRVPVPVFDTQLVAPMLGYDASSGYANLVKALLGVELTKSQTRTDWKRRPLIADQLRYAADDVIYLGEMYLVMQEKLDAADKSRLDAAHAMLADPLQYQPDPGSMWRRIRDAKRFSGDKLSVLQQLAAWREITARRENRPRKWVLPDAAIIDMARLLPADEAELANIKSVNENVIKKYGRELFDLIARARQENSY